MSKARILVVDDEPAVLKVLVTRLQLAGYQVYSATNGEEALESFHRDSPDLIVLDVMLPKMDGFAVCRRIRAESVVPIIFLTALEAISERVAGLDLGADDYLSKPFSPKELEARIATILRRMGPSVSVTETKEVPSGKGVMQFGSFLCGTLHLSQILFKNFSDSNTLIFISGIKNILAEVFLTGLFAPFICSQLMRVFKFSRRKLWQ